MNSEFYIFGSFAKTPDEANDIDLIFVGDGLEAYTEALEELSLKHNKPLEVFVNPDGDWVAKERFYPTALITEDVRAVMRGEDQFGANVIAMETKNGTWFTDTVYTSEDFFSEAKPFTL